MGFLARKLEKRIMSESSSKRAVRESVKEVDSRIWLCLRREKRGEEAKEEGR